ncbi:MAG TPA: class I SAM-dependent methyltransferase [Bacteroidota bacterium]|nr:class I SAM-dependent methyltransferase [Bacteroidota bacterium]
MQVTEHDKFYWQYEYDVVAKYLLPILRNWGVPIEGASLLDIGCGDGGGIAVFYDAGMTCKGFDIEPRRIELAKAMQDSRNLDVALGNIYADPPPAAGEKFDLVLLHDVFEHLDHKAEVLRRLTAYLKPNGSIFITFPPYYSAFGAHQQFLRSKFGKMPFFHLMPFGLSTIMPKLPNEEPAFIEEIQKLGRLKMGIGKFEKVVRESGLNISNKKFYIIGPNHIRFGLTPMDASVVGAIPGLRELMVSGVLYLLKKPA